MRIILADLKAKDGLVSKDTVAGGYGSRLVPFSRITRLFTFFKRRVVEVPSVQMAYLAAICAEKGHEVRWTQDEVLDGDIALVLSSLVDYRRETAWADAARTRGVRVGFVGLACSKMPELFRDHADFLILGEPESAVMKLASGQELSGLIPSEPIADLDTLPFPRWDLLENRRFPPRVLRRKFPLLASRGCPEFCTYCPHRILAGYRARSVANVVEELVELCGRYRRPYVIFRDPLFTQQRDRCLALCEEIQARRLDLTFECETRLDRLDEKLLDQMRAAGLRAITFGVESISSQTLKKVARRPIPEAHQQAMVEHCRRLGIMTCGFYIFGFLEDDWDSIGATIDYAIAFGATFAQFKILTPYPATPLWRQLQPRVRETDWERFDGFTLTFQHPNLSGEELRFLLGAAYARFYARPSWLANYLGIRRERVQDLVREMDRRTHQRHKQKEVFLMSRAVVC